MKILTAKYESGTTAVNSVIRITYEGQPDNSMVTVPVNENNSDYAEIMRQVDAGELTIEEAE